MSDKERLEIFGGGEGDEGLRKMRDDIMRAWHERQISPVPVTVGKLKMILNTQPDEALVLVRDLWALDSEPMKIDAVGEGHCSGDDDRECDDPAHYGVHLVVGAPRHEDVSDAA
jgi:hypothetical protein